MSLQQHLKDPDVSETTRLFPSNNPDTIVETGAQEIFESVISDEDHLGENEDVRLLREERLHHKTLSWFSRPSVFMLSFALLLNFLGMGAGLGPKMTLVLKMICEKLRSGDPTMSEQCHDPRIQAELNVLQSANLALTGLCGCLLSGVMGNLSDRYGRKHVLSLVTLTLLLGKVWVTYLILPDRTYNRYLFIATTVLENALGGTTVALSVASSYITDIVEPHQRNVSMGFIFGTLYAGLAVGPQLSNLANYFNHNDLDGLYLDLGLSIASVFVIIFLLPESRSDKLRRKSQSSHLQRKASFSSIESSCSTSSNLYTRLQIWRIVDMFTPMKLLWIPKHRIHGLRPRVNILLLLIIDNVMFLAATCMTAALISYSTYIFNWKAYNVSTYASVIGATKTICLFVISPAIMVFLKRHIKQDTKSVDNLDRVILLVSLVFDSFGPLIAILATNGSLLYASAAFSSLGALGGPTVQSTLVKHVSEAQSGALFGASSLLRSGITTVLSPLLLWINGKALGVFPALAFWIMLGFFIVAIAAVFFLRSYDTSLDTVITPSPSIPSIRPRPQSIGSSSNQLERQLNYGSTSQPSSPRR